MTAVINIAVVVFTFVLGSACVAWVVTFVTNTVLQVAPQQQDIARKREQIANIDEQAMEAGTRISALQDERSEAMDEEREKNRIYFDLQQIATRQSNPYANIVFEIGLPADGMVGLLLGLRGAGDAYPFNAQGSREIEQDTKRDIDLLIWAEPGGHEDLLPRQLLVNVQITSKRKWTYPLAELA